jgi:phosphatidylserine/phosphatidylglycerophosphate/cardiolipin synthase-like enzyme
LDILRPGETCWRIETADRAAFLVDTQSHFTAVYDALLKAKRSILLLGWGFDPRTRLAPDGADVFGEPDEIGHILLDLARERPELDIRLLIWKSALPVSATQEFFPHKARHWFKGTRIHFRLDDQVPVGACHHQKALVIDEQLAFLGGGDFCTDRWDSVSHRDDDLRRRLAEHPCHAPRHEVTVMADGAAARALGDMFRERWARSPGGAELEPRPGDPADDPWPAFVKPQLTNVRIGLGRTLPSWKRAATVREIRSMTLEAIRKARKIIYIENQYFTSPIVAEALAARLAEVDGPEIVLVSTHHAPSWFDRLTMDRVRGILVRRLMEADIFGRFAAYSPDTPGGRPIIVHSKVMVVDDEIARVGSANLNNRSSGFDTECEWTLEATTPEHRKAIAAFRDELVGHYMNKDAATVARAAGRAHSLIRAIEDLNRSAGRLRPIRPTKLGRAARLIADFHLGDPTATTDSMRPWKRRRALDQEIRTIAADGGMRRFMGSLRNLLSGADGPTPSA